jgi:spermidine synthase
VSADLSHELGASTSPRAIAVPALLLGLSCIGSQVVLLREMLTQGAGNELVVAVALSAWLILTGTGSLLAARRSKNDRSLASLLSWMVGLPFVALAARGGLILVAVRCVAPGAAIPTPLYLAVCCALLAPVCIPAGMLFVLLCDVARHATSAKAISRVYQWESIGTAAGGLLSSVLLVPLRSSPACLLALAALAGLIAACILPMRARFRAAIALGPLGLSLALLASHVDRWLDAMQFPGQEIVSSRDTPYGAITVTRQHGQTSVFADHALLASSEDVITSEETVHYALAQRPRPRRVLLIGGGLQGAIDEALKYQGVSVDWVERDQAVIDAVVAARRTRSWTNIRVFREDGRRALHGIDGVYDAVLIALPAPLSLQDNRFYTVEFFHEVRRALRQDGVLSFGLLPDLDYYSSEARLLRASVLRALRREFPYTCVIPGSKNMFLASGAPLRMDIARLIDERGIENAYVNRYYIDDAMLRERAASFLRELPAHAPVNTDTRPAAFTAQIALWLTEHGMRVWGIIAVAILFAALALRKASAGGVPLFAAAFSGSGGQIILLFGFQVVFGSLFLVVGAMVAVFMLGLALGARVSSSSSGVRRKAIAAQFRLAMLLVATPILWMPGIGEWSDSVLFPVFAMFNGAIAYQVGVLFAVRNMTSTAGLVATAAEAYGVDLVGSALGVLVTTLVLIPWLGMTGSALFLACIMAVSLAVTLPPFVSRRVHIGDVEY